MKDNLLTFPSPAAMIEDMEDNSVLVKIQPITFEHPTVVYVPVYQVNFDENGMPVTPYFQYSLKDAHSDEQMVASMEPDYILELRGEFKATTKPYKILSD